MSVPISRQQTQQPLRRCVICNAHAHRSDLLRLVRKPDGEILVSTREQGRGAYVHPKPDCLSAASSQPRHLNRSLRQAAPAAILNQLSQFAPTPTSGRTHMTANPDR